MDANHETNSELEVEQDSRPRGRGLLTACVIVLFLGVIGLGVAYAQLHRAHERTLAELGSTEDDLRQSESRSYQLTRDLDEESSRLRTCRDELDGVSSRLASAMSTIRGVESSLGLSRNRNNDLAGQVDGLASQIDDLASRYASCSSALRVARNDATTWNSEAVRLASELDECVDAANDWNRRAVELADELNECVGIANDRQQRMNSAIETANSGILFITAIPGEGFSSLSLLGDPYERLRGQYNDLVDRFNAAINRCNDLSSLLARSLQELEGY